MALTTIVVPCYNEANRLDVERFSRVVADDTGLRLLFVDDGSSDRTLDVLEAIRSGCVERIDILSLPRNLGKAEAVRRGLLRAFSDASDFVGYWDADLATPLEVVAEFRDLLGARPGLSMVSGARVRLLGRSIQRRGMRHLLGRLFATAVSQVLRLPVYDTQCGAKLFRATPGVASLFDRPFLSRWIFDVEIIARLIESRRASGLAGAADAIYEFPLQEWRDVDGSKIRGRDFARATLDLIRIHGAHRDPGRPRPPHAPIRGPRGIKENERTRIRENVQ